jgi:hypothetical protein
MKAPYFYPTFRSSAIALWGFYFSTAQAEIGVGTVDGVADGGTLTIPGNENWAFQEVLTQRDTPKGKS